MGIIIFNWNTFTKQVTSLNKFIVKYSCKVLFLLKNTTNISICMDADLKAQADALFTELGMNLTTAFKVPLYLSPWPSGYQAGDKDRNRGIYRRRNTLQNKISAI